MVKSLKYSHLDLDSERIEKERRVRELGHHVPLGQRRQVHQNQVLYDHGTYN